MVALVLALGQLGDLVAVARASFVCAYAALFMSVWLGSGGLPGAPQA